MPYHCDHHSNPLRPCRAIVWVSFALNSLTGTLASELGLLTEANIFSVNGNLISGTLPSEIGQLTKLHELDLWNTQIGGQIPEELYTANYAAFNAVILGYNQFTGTISGNIGKLSTVTSILLAGNTGLTGSIPSEMGLLTRLWKLTIDGTGLSGSIPLELCALRGRSTLARLKADCEEISNGTTPMFCEVGCCTNCCNAETGFCTKTGF